MSQGVYVAALLSSGYSRAGDGWWTKNGVWFRTWHEAIKHWEASISAPPQTTETRG